MDYTRPANRVVYGLIDILYDEIDDRAETDDRHDKQQELQVRLPGMLPELQEEAKNVDFSSDVSCQQYHEEQSTLLFVVLLIKNIRRKNQYFWLSTRQMTSKLVTINQQKQKPTLARLLETLASNRPTKPTSCRFSGVNFKYFKYALQLQVVVQVQM